MELSSSQRICGLAFKLTDWWSSGQVYFNFIIYFSSFLFYTVLNKERKENKKKEHTQAFDKRVRVRPLRIAA